MSALANLKLTATKKPVQMSPVVARRNKVAKRIFEQIQLASAKQAGNTYAPTKQRTVKDAETGESKIVQVPKRVKPWSWVGENGKTCLSLHYGSKVVAIEKGKATIELASDADLVATLESLKTAVLGGELDAQLEAVSGAVKAGFKK